MTSPPITPSWQPSDALREIERLVNDVVALAGQLTARQPFYDGLLDRAVRATAADAGFVWVPGSGGAVVSICRVSGGAPHPDAVEDQHAALAAAVLQRAEPADVGVGDQGRHAALFCPVMHAGRVAAVVEVVLPPEIANQGRQNCLNVLHAMCQLAADFHHRCTVRELEDTRRQCLQFEQFADRLHGSLRQDVISYALANDGRQIAACDRLSVLLVRGTRCRAVAVSGADVVDRRSPLVQSLESLARCCVVQGEPLWYHGSVEDLAPQLQRALRDYLDLSHARRLGVLPLRESPATSRGEVGGPILGLLVGEDFDAHRDRDEFERLLQRIVRPGATALSNAAAYRAIPFLHTLSQLTRIRWFFQAGRLPKTAIALVAVLACAIAMFLIPVDFEIPGRGTLQPRAIRHLFAPEEGVVEQVHIEHGQEVTPGQLLLRLKKPELELKLTEVVGDLQTAQQLLQSVAARRFAAGRSGAASVEEKNQLAAEQESLKERVANLTRQQQILQRRVGTLSIHSPIKGQVLTWDVAERLADRPVARGAKLLTVADPSGPWSLELQVDDRHVRHLLDARRKQAALPVTYRLATRPQTTYRGTLEEVAIRSEVAEGRDKPSVTVLVSVRSADLKSPHPGAETVARITCGRRPVGYVLLRDLWEAIQLHVLF